MPLPPPILPLLPPPPILPPLRAPPLPPPLLPLPLMPPLRAPPLMPPPRPPAPTSPSRIRCVFKQSVATAKYSLWWDYVLALYERCSFADGTYTTQCVGKARLHPAPCTLHPMLYTVVYYIQ